MASAFCLTVDNERKGKLAPLQFIADSRDIVACEVTAVTTKYTLRLRSLD